MPDLIELLGSRPLSGGRLRRRASVAHQVAAGDRGPGAHRADRVDRADRSEDGFVLLETMVAITVITVIMAALTTLFITVMSSTSHQRSSQAGAQIVDSALDKAHGMGAAGDVKGLGSSRNPAWFAAAPSSVQTWLTAMTPAYDASAAASAGDTATLPTKGVVQTVNGKSFTVSYYVGWCNRQPNGSCTTAVGGIQYVRVVVAVTWNDHTCGAAGCKYVSATLVNGAADPVFLFNQAPPAKPNLATIPSQTSAVGDVVTGPQASTPTGVPTLFFSAPNAVGTSFTGLPPGLAMNQAGLVTGTPTRQGTYTVTVNVIDAFQNTDTTTFTWLILPPLAFNNPTPPTSIMGSAITTTSVTATGGTGTGYQWTASGLPTGLSISSGGVITGTPTAAGNYSVTLTVADSTVTRKLAGSAFTWTVNYPPVTATLSSQAATLNRPIAAVQLAAAGGSGSYAWSATGLPDGLSMTAGGKVTGTVTKLGTFTVSVTITSDPLTSGGPLTKTFTWTVNNVPTITTPGTQTATVGKADSLTMSVNGGSTPYTWTATGLGSSGLSINSSTGVISGTPTATGTLSVTVTATDQFGATAQTGAFDWKVLAPPTVAGPASASTTITGTDTFNATYTCPNTPCTFSLAGTSVSWLSIDNSGVITATNAGSTATGIKVVITDSAGVSVTSSSFTWTVVAKPTITTPANQTSYIGSAVSYQVASTCVSTPCTYALVGTWPTGWTISNTGLISGTAPATVSTNSVLSVKITDDDSVTAVTSAFKWFFTNMKWNAIPTQSTQHSRSATSLGLAGYLIGGSGSYTYTISGQPSGLSVSTAGVISGTVSNGATLGNYTVTVTATDKGGSAVGAAVTTTFTWTVT